MSAGVDFLWRVVLDMPSKEGQLISSSHAVVRASQEMLIRLYQRHDRDSPMPAVSAVPLQLCAHFVRSAAPLSVHQPPITVYEPVLA